MQPRVSLQLTYITSHCHTHFLTRVQHVTGFVCWAILAVRFNIYMFIFVGIFKIKDCIYPGTMGLFMGAGLLSFGEIMEVLMEVFFIYREASKVSQSKKI